jgi:type IV secretion system protein TrbF
MTSLLTERTQPSTTTIPTASGARRSPALDLNPYIAARREWDERYGSLITRAKNWRTIALLCASTVVLETGGLVALSMRSRVIPYVVAVDNLGRQVAAGPADQASVADDKLRRAAIFEWVGDLRVVTNDGVAQRKAIDRVYAHIANSSQAMGFINDFYRSDPPQKRAETQTVDADVQSVLPTSDKTFEVEWMETTRDLQGQVTQQVRWKGAFTVVVNPPTDERLLRINPLGIYVTNTSWSKVL